MGLFSKKPKRNKIYTLQEAMDFINKNKGFSVIQDEGGYKVIPDEIANMHIARYKARMQEKENFRNEILTGFTPSTTEKTSHTYEYRTYDMER